MEREQWRLVWDGEAAFWEMAPKLLAAGRRDYGPMRIYRWW